MQIYVIYDAKTDSYNDPSYAPNDGDLCRQLVNMFRDPRQSMNKYLLNAEDYQIFGIGNYCYKTGSIEAHPPQHIANMHELRTAAVEAQEQFSAASLQPPQGQVTPDEKNQGEAPRAH